MVLKGQCLCGQSKISQSTNSPLTASQAQHADYRLTVCPLTFRSLLHTSLCAAAQHQPANTRHTALNIDTPKGQIACHCDDCKHTSGAPYSSNILAPEKDVQFSGPVKEFVAKAASGNDVTRTFCSNCGGALAHNSKAFGDSMAVQTGNFEEAKSWPFEAELFVKVCDQHLPRPLPVLTVDCRIGSRA